MTGLPALLRTDGFNVADDLDTDTLVRTLRELSERDAARSAVSSSGFCWFFSAEPDDWEADSLVVGVRGNVGALEWFTPRQGYVPADGLNQEHIEYYTYDTHVMVLPPGAEIPIGTMCDALREYARTGQRPTCVEWVPEGDEDAPYPALDEGHVMVTPGTDVDEVLRELDEQERPRVWSLFLSADQTDPRLQDPRPPMLLAGLDQTDGCLLWSDTTGHYIPAHGDSTDREFVRGTVASPVPKGSVVPIEDVYRAVREVVATRQRPSCVQWQPRPI